MSFIQEIMDLQTSLQGLLILTDVIQMIETKQNHKLIWTLVNSTLGIAGTVLFIICFLLNQSAVFYTCIFEGFQICVAP